MGICKYCKTNVGLFKSYHKECKKKYEEGHKEMLDKMQLYFTKPGSISIKDLEKELLEISHTHLHDDNQFRNTLIEGFEKCVDRAFDDGVLTEDEENILNEIANHFSFTQEDLNKNNAITRVAQGGVLRDILNGEIPNRFHVDGHVPFNLQKSENLVWVFQDVAYYEQKTRREFVGGHHGFSMKVAKGLYYRAGAFRGKPVETKETVYIDSGFLGITTKHIYFTGPEKSFRIKYDKIVSFTPYSDGIGIQKDGVRAKPQTFIIGDGWFVYNLLTNISKL